MEAKAAVECGYWINYRYNPQLKAEGKKSFFLDSKAPTGDLKPSSVEKSAMPPSNTNSPMSQRNSSKRPRKMPWRGEPCTNGSMQNEEKLG